MKQVIKTDGSTQPFNNEKFNRWCQFADKVGANWSQVAIDTYARLPSTVRSEEIHQTMINVCIEAEDLAHSRMASRLEYATIRKGMDTVGINDKDTFLHILITLTDLGVWNPDVLPNYNGNISTVKWDDWYRELREIYLDCWTIQQWIDKYSLRYNDVVVETPHIGILGLALSIYGDTQEAFDYAKAVLEGKINLPTPVINGCRNGDFNTISCCVISGGDSVESIDVATHIASRMTAKQAGIGVELRTRSKGDDVRNGRVKHLGKTPLYKTICAVVKNYTHPTRGGSATMTFTCIDPEVEKLLLLKTQKLDLEQRIDKMDYSFAYNDAFVKAVIQDSDWYLFSNYTAHGLVEQSFYTDTVEQFETTVKARLELGYEHKVVKARDILKAFLTSRQETGRVYCINVSRANEHTPFNDKITLSNLCQEIMLPTEPYNGMEDLYNTKISEGETAFCSLSAINVSKVSTKDYESIAKLCLEAVDILISKAPMMTPSMEHAVRDRRSVGIGITGLASALYKDGLDYDGSEESYEQISYIAERHAFYLYKASTELVVGDGVTGISNWLPIDTMKHHRGLYSFAWEQLRGKPRRNSVLVAHMPTESSSLFSGATNGLYPVRDKVIYKGSRKGVVQFICPEAEGKLTAWDVQSSVLSKSYGLIQDWTDQGISCDYYVDFNKFPDGKVPLSKLMKDWIAHDRAGNKSMYYSNTNEGLTAGFIPEDESCSSGGCKL